VLCVWIVQLANAVRDSTAIVHSRHIVNAVLTGPLPNAGNSFIVADSYLRNIYQVDITTGVTSQLLQIGTAYSPIALAYDSTAKLVYWTDVTAHTINRYSLLTNSITVIYSDPSATGTLIN